MGLSCRLPHTVQRMNERHYSKHNSSSLPLSLSPSLSSQHESQQRENWQLMSEVDKLRFRVIELERGALIGGRRPGDSTTDDRPSELGFQRSALRSTYHGQLALVVYACCLFSHIQLPLTLNQPRTHNVCVHCLHKQQDFIWRF